MHLSSLKAHAYAAKCCSNSRVRIKVLAEDNMYIQELGVTATARRHLAVERRVGVPEAHQLEQRADDGALQVGLRLLQGEPVPVDGTPRPLLLHCL